MKCKKRKRDQQDHNHQPWHPLDRMGLLGAYTTWIGPTGGLNESPGTHLLKGATGTIVANEHCICFY